MSSLDFTNKGFATYRLKLKQINSGEEVLALRIMPVYTAYKLWINGRLVAETGRVGEVAADAIPKLMTKYLFFKNEKEVELVFQVANLEYSRGGFLKGIELGTQTQILKKRETVLAAELFLCGALIMMSLYHFGLYLLRKKDASALFFGFFCLLIGTRTLLVGETFFNYLLPGVGLHEELKLHAVILYLAPVTFYLFINSLYPREVSKRLLKLFAVVSVTGLVLSLILGTLYFGAMLSVYEIFISFYLFYLFWVLIKALKKRREGALIALAGYVILAAATINDILFDYELINTGYLVSLGLFLFIFSQAYLLSERFSMAFSKVEAIFPS